MSPVTLIAFLAIALLPELADPPAIIGMSLLCCGTCRALLTVGALPALRLLAVVVGIAVRHFLSAKLLLLFGKRDTVVVREAALVPVHA